MDVDPEGAPHALSGGVRERGAVPPVDRAAPGTTQNQNKALNAPPVVWPPPPSGHEVGAVISRERAARSEAEARAARAEEGAAALRATLAVVTSVAEISIEAAALLFDESRRYAHVLTESAREDQRLIMETASADAFQVIAEARATVAELRADLLEDLVDDEPVEISEVAAKGADDVAVISRRRLRRRRDSEQGTEEMPQVAVAEAGNDEGSQAPVSRPTAGEVG